MTKEEVIIQLGLDNAALKNGMTASNFLIENSVQKTLSSLKNLVAINMVEMGLKAVSLWDGFTKDMAKGFYANVYDATERALGNFRDRLRKLVGAMSQSEQGLQKANRDFDFAVASDPEKLAILDAEQRADAKRIKAMQRDVEASKKWVEATKAFGEHKRTADYYEQNVRLPAVEKIAKLEIQINAARVAMLDREKEVLELREKISKSAAKTPAPIPKATDVIITPDLPNTPAGRLENWMRSVNQSQANYFNQIASSTLDPAARSKFRGMADLLVPSRDGMTGASGLGAVESELAKHTDALNKLVQGVNIIPHP